jgi:hypothetical protein
MTSEAQFMGGPLDGQIHAFPAKTPPPLIAVPVLDEPIDWEAPPDRWPTRFRQITYQRQVSQLDNGPLWVFVPLA